MWSDNETYEEIIANIIHIIKEVEGESLSKI